MSAIVRLHKDGDNLAISTDAKTEQEFLDALMPLLAERLETFVGPEPGMNDMEFQLDRWIPQIIDIACKLRGYKSEVQEHRVLVAGQWYPPEVVEAMAPYRRGITAAISQAMEPART